MLTKLFNFVLGLISIFAWIYGILELFWLIILVILFYGIFVIWMIQDPVLTFNKITYFLGITLLFGGMIYATYIYDENKDRNKRANPIKEDLDKNQD